MNARAGVWICIEASLIAPFREWNFFHSTPEPSQKTLAVWLPVCFGESDGHSLQEILARIERRNSCLQEVLRRSDEFIVVRNEHELHSTRAFVEEILEKLSKITFIEDLVV